MQPTTSPSSTTAGIAPAASPRPIRFWHQGRIVEVSGVSPTRSVLDWLREDRRLTGTKEGCNEGDCGACMVLVADLPADPAASAADLLPPAPARSGAAATARATGGSTTPALRLRPLNACLLFLPALDGKALFTVEDLQLIAAQARAPVGGMGGGMGGLSGGHAPIRLHPAQQALVDCHGSQCGFCTPGFAVSLSAFYETHAGQPPGPAQIRQQLADALAGNLCRCTGYKPIVEAGVKMFELPGAWLDRAALAQALQQLAQDPPLHYAGPAAHDPAQTAAFHAPRDAAALAAQLQDDASAHAAAATATSTGGAATGAPATSTTAPPPATPRLLGGATDMGLWVNKGHRPMGTLTAIAAAADLGRIETVGAAPDEAAAGIAAWLRIGAAVSLEDGWRALAAPWPELTELWRRFASPPVRHAGTLVGNLANGSPIGDTAPVGLALDARLVLRQGSAERRLALPDFYLGYMKNALAPGEFVSHVEWPLPSATAGGSRHLLRAWKVSKRYDSDISALCAGLAIRVDAAGTVTHARIAFGGMAAVAQRAARAEAALLGQPWSGAAGEAAVRAAMAALAQDYTPLTDLRATAAYRQRVAANLLWRFWLETGPAALAPHQTQVWAAGGLLATA